MACIIDSCVPTASMTECAPRPLVRSLSFATPPSPRSVMTSVAPKSPASFCRSSWRLKMTMRSAPSCLAASTPRRPTAPSPTTATVLPAPGVAGAGVGGAGGEPAVAEQVRGGEQARDEVVVGHAGGGDEGAVGERDARVFGLGADGADEAGVDAAGPGAAPRELA